MAFGNWKTLHGQVSNPTTRIKIHYQLKQKEVKPKEEVLRKRILVPKSKASIIPSATIPLPAIESSRFAIKTTHLIILVCNEMPYDAR